MPLSFNDLCEKFAEFGQGAATLGWTANFNRERNTLREMMVDEGHRINWHEYSLYERAAFEHSYITAYMHELHKRGGKGWGLYNPPLCDATILH